MSLGDRTFGIAPVNSITRALQMRTIRNKVRKFMTHNTKEIGIIEQVRWFLFDYMKSNNRAYLVMAEKDAIPVGYGLVMQRGDEWTVTGALLEEYRGKGMGRTLFQYLTQDALLSSGKDVFLDVLSTNLPAIQLYISLGYRPIAIDEENHVIKMKWSGKMAQA